MLVLLGLFMFVLFVFPPLVFPPMLLDGVIAGVGVLVGTTTVLVVLLLVEFVLSLPQPIPKAARASKVRRAKVLRIELSPVTQRGQIVRELIWKRAPSKVRWYVSASTRSIV
jgi:hypothetical protein